MGTRAAWYVLVVPLFVLVVIGYRMIRAQQRRAAAREAAAR